VNVYSSGRNRKKTKQNEKKKRGMLIMLNRILPPLLIYITLMYLCIL